MIARRSSLELGGWSGGASILHAWSPSKVCHGDIHTEGFKLLPTVWVLHINYYKFMLIVLNDNTLLNIPLDRGMVDNRGMVDVI